MPNYEKQLKNIIENDMYMLEILKTVEKLKLADAWISAGFIRNKVWDLLTDKITSPNDIDVIYFDLENTSIKAEKLIEKQLEELLPNQPWSVKNQARMHRKSNLPPFQSTFDGIAHFPETPTAIAVRYNLGKIEILAPYGLTDLFEMKVKPTPYYMENGEHYTTYQQRIQRKKWETIWPNLQIEIKM